MALFLFAIVLVVLADLVNGYRGVIRHSQGRSRTLKSAQVALTQVRSDIMAATKILTPPASNPYSLRLERLPAGASPRLPETVPQILPSSWTVLDPNDLYNIDYRLDSDKLLRAVSGNDLTLATEISDFTVTVLPSQYEVTLVVKEELREFKLLSRVSRL